MSATEDFLNSLSEEDRKIWEEAKNTPPIENKSQEELVFETYSRILNMGVAGGKISEQEKDNILSEFKRNGN